MSIYSKSHAYWSGRAAEYSALHMAEYETPDQTRFKTIIEQYLPRVNGAVRALDVGAGSGFLTLLLAQMNCEVTAIDFSQDMLDEAKKNASQQGFSNIEFFKMPAQSLDFSDNTFDIVVTRNVTWVLEDVASVYAEMMRVLKPGGVLINMDANYGKAFASAEKRGETPVHVTQTLDQLLTRNSLVRDLEITQRDRPTWDIATLWNLNATHIECFRSIEELLAYKNIIIKDEVQQARFGSSLFVLAAFK